MEWVQASKLISIFEKTKKGGKMDCPNCGTLMQPYWGFPHVEYECPRCSFKHKVFTESRDPRKHKVKKVSRKNKKEKRNEVQKMWKRKKGDRKSIAQQTG